MPGNKTVNLIGFVVFAAILIHFSATLLIKSGIVDVNPVVVTTKPMPEQPILADSEPTGQQSIEISDAQQFRLDTLAADQELREKYQQLKNRRRSSRAHDPELEIYRRKQHIKEALDSIGAKSAPAGSIQAELRDQLNDLQREDRN